MLVAPGAGADDRLIRRRHAVGGRGALLLVCAKCPAHSDGYYSSVQVAICTEERPSDGGEHFHFSIHREGYAAGNVE